jgi:hypothetical protein
MTTLVAKEVWVSGTRSNILNFVFLELVMRVRRRAHDLQCAFIEPLDIGNAISFRASELSRERAARRTEKKGHEMSMKSLVKKIRKLGINLNTNAGARRLQGDLLQRLRQANVKEQRYSGLADCGPSRCGRESCSDVCPFGMWRRLASSILAVHRLVKRLPGPVHQVRLARDVWERRTGELHLVSLGTVKRLNKRALDNLRNPNVVAVGTVRVSVQDREPRWAVQIHEIVVGAEKAELERVFALLACVREVNRRQLAHVINDVMRCDLQIWRHPFQNQVTGPRPTAARRAEFYEWMLGVKVGARALRYGCDRQYKID